jgi:hypothetical protein
MPILGQMTEQVIELDAKAAENTEDFEQKARLEWKDRESNDIGNMDTLHQQLDTPDIRTLIGSRIKYLSEFNINNDGTKKDWCWCRGVVERVCDDTWVKAGKRRQCYKAGEAAEVLWGEIDMPVSQTQEPFDPRKWNKNCTGGWRIDLGIYNYGV